MTRPAVTTTTEGDITVSVIAVDLDLANADAISEALLKSVPNDSRGLVVDLTAVGYMDSVGVRSFFELARQLQVARQLLAFVVPLASPIRRLIKLTRLDEVAVLAPTVDEGVSAVHQAWPGGG